VVPVAAVKDQKALMFLSIISSVQLMFADIEWAYKKKDASGEAGE
jgi:hypothetical protein